MMVQRHLRRTLICGVLLLALPVLALTPASAQAVAVGFKAKVTLQGETSTNPTSLQFGPDGRLYVAQQDGLIKAYTIARDAPSAPNGAGVYRVTATEVIDLVQKITNRNDDGTPNPSVNTRLITGILVTGTATNPVIYVTSSDPRFGGEHSGGTDSNLDTNSGIVSRLTRSGGSWQKLDLVRGLPRSENIHSVNGLQLDHSTNTLFVSVGGHTNHGAPSTNFAMTPEYAYSAAILSVDLGEIGNTTYDIPTLDDEDRAGNPDQNDPFGGNDGKNQARLVPGGPVQVYASGFRNSYDLALHSSGRLYATDNGGNQGSGDVPPGEGPSGTCTNAPRDGGFTDRDGLYLVSGPGYYQGHPNPTRANRANTFNSNGQTPIPLGMQNPIECDHQTSGSSTRPKENDALTTFNLSTNGIVEYRASNFGGEMRGDLLLTNFQDVLFRVELNSSGTFSSKSQLFSSVGDNPLDVTAQGDGGPFPGTIWVANHQGNDIVAFEPNDFSGTPPPVCTGADDPSLDEDGDGYSNSDEIDNGTDPCSAGDVPPDADSDSLSDMNDPDDDNDGSPDTSDRFAIDPANGLATPLSVRYTWDPVDPSPGGLMGSGFTGLMTNGTSDYQDLYDPDNLTIGGAPGLFTVDEVQAGDASGSTNTQAYGFQFGIPIASATGPVTIHTRVMTPFAGSVPQDSQSMGLMLGTGSQDDYVRLVVHANGGAGGVLFSKEVGGTQSASRLASEAMPGPDWVDLYLEIEPGASTVQPRYSVTTGGVTGPLRDLGAPEPIPSSWVSGPAALAVGIISTSAGPGPEFPATWDFIEVQAPAPPSDSLFSDGFESGDLSRWTDFNKMVVQQQEVLAGSWAARAVSTAGTTAFAWKQLDPAQAELYVKTGFKLISKGSSKVLLMKLTTGTGGGILAPLVSSQGKLGYRNLVAGVDRNSSISVTPGWHQLEVEVSINGASSQIETWLDGIRIDALSRTDSLGTGPIGRLYLGETATGRTYDMAFDEVLVDESRAGGGGQDGTAPTTPENLSAVAASSSRVDLSWTASMDNVGVTGYEIQRDSGSGFVTIATIGDVTSYPDTTVAAGTTYSYRVRAFDAAGNHSPFSASASATTHPAPPSDSLFSDGFESGDLSRWTDFNKMVVQQQEVLAGSWAARAVSTAGTTAFAWKQLDPAQAELYVKTGFKLISKGSSKVLLMKLTTGTGGGILAPLVSSQGKLGYRNLVAGVDRNSSISVTPGWHQLEVEVSINGASSQIETWLDGIRIDALSRTDSLGTGPIGRLYLGETATGRTYDMAFDEVLVDESRATVTEELST
jgi:hypothetical protein